MLNTPDARCGTLNTGTAVATQACTDLDDAPSNTVELLTGSQAGTLVIRVAAVPRSTVTTTALYLFVSSDGGATQRLIRTKLAAADTVSSTDIPTEIDFCYNITEPLLLTADEKLFVAISVDLTEGWVFHAEGIDVGEGAGFGKVLVSSGDTTAKFLSDAASAGNSIDLTILQPGGDEMLQISLASPLISVDIDSGSIDNTTIGANSAAAGTFSALSCSGSVSLGTASITVGFSSNLIPTVDDMLDLGAAGAEWRNLYIDGMANIDSLVANTANINGGTIDDVTIGGSSAGAGTFSSLVATTADINSGTIDGATIGASSAAAGTFTIATTSSLAISSTNPFIQMTDTDNGSAEAIISANGASGSLLLRADDNDEASGSFISAYVDGSLVWQAAAGGKLGVTAEVQIGGHYEWELNAVGSTGSDVAILQADASETTVTITGNLDIALEVPSSGIGYDGTIIITNGNGGGHTPTIRKAGGSEGKWLGLGEPAWNEQSENDVTKVAFIYEASGDLLLGAYVIP